MPELIHLSETHSTNLYLRHLKDVNRNVEVGVVVWSDLQTSGRGQVGNKWESEHSQNLLFSFLLLPSNIDAKDQFIISQIVSLGIIDILNNLKTGFSIKWTNDIYFEDKKIAGMLIENDMSGRQIYSSIIGIGLNVNQENFSDEIPNAISLKNILGRSFDREELLYNILEKISFYYNEIYDNKLDTI